MTSTCFLFFSFCLISFINECSPIWLCSSHWSSYGRQMIQASTTEWLGCNINERRRHWIMPVIRKLQRSMEFNPYTNFHSFFFLTARIWSCSCHTMKNLKNYKYMYRLKWISRNKNWLKWISFLQKETIEAFGLSKPNHLSSEIV